MYSHLTWCSFSCPRGKTLLWTSETISNQLFCSSYLCHPWNVTENQSIFFSRMNLSHVATNMAFLFNFHCWHWNAHCVLLQWVRKEGPTVVPAVDRITDTVQQDMTAVAQGQHSKLTDKQLADYKKRKLIKDRYLNLCFFSLWNTYTNAIPCDRLVE